MKSKTALALFAVILPLGCGTRERRHVAPPRVELVARDSSDAGDGMYVWYRVAVHTGRRVDTLPGIMTHEQPNIDAQGRLVGLAFDSTGAVKTGYRYDPDTHALQRIPLPKDMSSYFSEATLSPDQRFLAYIAQDEKALSSAVVVTWPDLREMGRVRAGSGFGSDVNFNHLRWNSPTQAEFAIRIEAMDGPWVHVVMSTRSTTQVDTLSKEPDWPQRS